MCHVGLDADQETFGVGEIVADPLKMCSRICDGIPIVIQMKQFFDSGTHSPQIARPVR